MASIDKLKTKSLEDLTLHNTFVYLMNITTNVESRISLTTLIGGAAITTGVGASVYAGLVNNALNFRSLKSDSSIVSITSTKTQVNFNVLPQYIDLSLCKNTTSNFLSTVDLTTKVGSTILPVANGGTGSSTLGTAGQFLSVNAGATALEYSSASFIALATSTLDMDNNNIDLGTGWINKNGIGSYGFYIDSSNKAHFVPDGQTTTGGTAGINVSGDIFLQGTVDRNITLGASATGNGSVLTMNGSLPGTGSYSGGVINIKPGSSTTGAGGDLNLYAGASTGGAAGNVRLYARNGADTTFPILRVTNSKKVSIQNSTSDSTPVGLLDIKQTEGAGAMPVLRLEQTDPDYAFSQFTGTTAADSTTNISSSTATVGTKTGAIKVLVQNGAETASVAWIRLYSSAV